MVYDNHKSLNEFGYIPLLTMELAALERQKNQSIIL